MRKKIALFILVSSLIFTRCDDSNQLQKPTIDKNALSKVLSSSDNFQILVNAHISFLSNIENNYRSLTPEASQKLKGIVNKFSSFSSVDDLIKNSTKDDINFVLGLSKEAKSLSSPLEKLINEIQGRYNFDFADFFEIVTATVDSKLQFKEVKNGRAQLSCSSTCSNKAEAYYWAVFQATRDVDTSGYAAKVYYAGCLDGCLQ